MYELLIAEMRSQPWAILPEKLAVISDLLAFRASGQRYTPEEIQARIGPSAGRDRAVTRAPGMVAVLPLTGVLQNRAGAMEESSGVVGMDKIGRVFSALVNDPEIKAIVLDIDSPGGTVAGTMEFAQAIFEARSDKPVAAVANHMAASAAFWLMSAASEAYVSPSGMVGSVGVLRMHQDVSKMAENEGVKTTYIHSGKHKVEGNPFEPLSEESLAYLQAECDKMYSAFVGDLARNRRVSRAHIEASFGQGRMLQARDAVAAGMVDGVMTLDQVLAKFGAASGAPARGARAMAEMTSWTTPLPLVIEESTEEQEAAKAEFDADERDPEHVRRARELALAKARYS